MIPCSPIRVILIEQELLSEMAEKRKATDADGDSSPAKRHQEENDAGLWISFSTLQQI